jgi:hypothetical protein
MRDARDLAALADTVHVRGSDHDDPRFKRLAEETAKEVP